jgi:hypothetical protein
MTNKNVQSNEAGFALVLTILVSLIIGSLVAAAVAIASNHMLVNQFYERQSDLEMAADQGLEWARAKLNSDKTLYPASGYTTLENRVQVTNGAGQAIPGVFRSVYAGPSGVTSGQYGVFGTILAVVEDAGRGKVIRRSQVFQESFSKYAYFTDIEPSSISFGGGDQIFGPVHTNDYVKIYSSGATFHQLVRTAKTVTTPQYGVFKQGYEQNVAPIAMPATAELSRLQAQAAAGGTSFTGTTSGAVGEATTRIEFMAIDLNGDGDQSDADEGFIRVYQSTNTAWLTGTSATLTTLKQCGDFHAGVFKQAVQHPISGESATTALSSASKRCYLGGSDSISGGFVASDGTGQWLTYGGTVSSLLAARADKNYLFPITRSLNPNFKGVIYVSGKVVISGRVRGRVTVAASSDIIIGDDITYVTDPGAGTCVDILGIFSANDVIVANNFLNAPWKYSSATTTYRTYDDTKDEFIHGTVLALGNFWVKDYDSGSDSDEDCESTDSGRGCLYLTGGIIQTERGAVGTTAGTGYVKRYSYDTCGATNPPPYFPTTGYFAKGQYYNVDPMGFTVGSFFDLITPG